MLQKAKAGLACVATGSQWPGLGLCLQPLLPLLPISPRFSRDTRRTNPFPAPVSGLPPSPGSSHSQRGFSAHLPLWKCVTGVNCSMTLRSEASLYFFLEQLNLI